MLAQALEAEVAEYIERHWDARDDKGHALVVRTLCANIGETLRPLKLV